jgi:hypothetical protein
VPGGTIFTILPVTAIFKKAFNMTYKNNDRRDTVNTKFWVMKRNFLLHINRNTILEIPFEEITFLTSLKANTLDEIVEEIYLIEITLTNTDTEHIGAIVKVNAYSGEFTGYSCGTGWDDAITKAFESIMHQIRLLANYPMQENTN